MIECHGVRFSYDCQRDALGGVSLSVRDGDFVCVLGGNGSGKSTLARHLDALLVPDAGSVAVDGLDTRDVASAFDIRSRVGIVFQNPDDQIVGGIVEDDVAFGPENLGLPREELARRVTQALARVGLAGFEQRETSTLSGGQKQRLALAGVLAMHPGTLVLDEASSMLDPRGRRGLMRACHELHDQGLSIVMVTHFMEEAAEADRVIVLDEGRVTLEGTPDEVFSHAGRLVELGLDVPFAAHLSLALRARGVDAGMHVRERELIESLNELRKTSHPTNGRGPATATEATESAPFDGRVPGASENLATLASAQTTSALPGGGTEAAEPALLVDHVSFGYDARAARKALRDARHGAERTGAVASDARQPGTNGRPNSPWVLRDVSLEIGTGELVGLAGHTGSGKSTLIQLLGGLARPTAGRILLHGRDLARRPGGPWHADASTQGRVGIVFQYPERQLFAQTVRDDVAFGPRNLGLRGEELDRLVRDAIRGVGLDPDVVGDMSPFDLSGGQRRRVAFAGVLAMEPEVIVFDEPAAGLDPRSRREFLRLVRKLHATGRTVVMSSHDMDDLAKLCDRIVVLDHGAILAQGTPAEVFSQEDLLRVAGLGLPAAQAAASDLARAGWPLDARAPHTVDSLAAEIAQALRSGNSGNGGSAADGGTSADGPAANEPACDGSASPAKGGAR